MPTATSTKPIDAEDAVRRFVDEDIDDDDDDRDADTDLVLNMYTDEADKLISLLEGRPEFTSLRDELLDVRDRLREEVEEQDEKDNYRAFALAHFPTKTEDEIHIAVDEEAEVELYEGGANVHVVLWVPESHISPQTAG